MSLTLTDYHSNDKKLQYQRPANWNVTITVLL